MCLPWPIEGRYVAQSASEHLFRSSCLFVLLSFLWPLKYCRYGSTHLLRRRWFDGILPVRHFALSPLKDLGNRHRLAAAPFALVGRLHERKNFDRLFATHRRLASGEELADFAHGWLIAR